MAAILKELVDAGLQGAKLVAAFERIEAAAPMPTDETAERRRAWDRQRKAAKRAPNSTGIPPESAETGGIPPEQSETSRTRSISSSLPSEVKDKSSEANASGAIAPIDPIEKLWSEGPKRLGEMRTPDGRARQMIGKWLSDTAGDALKVLAAIDHARSMGSRDAVPLVTRLLKPKHSTGPPNSPVYRNGAVAALAEELANAGHHNHPNGSAEGAAIYGARTRPSVVGGDERGDDRGYDFELKAAPASGARKV